MSLPPLKSPRIGRRQLLKLGLGAGAVGLMPSSNLWANTVSTRARVVILGGGAAGMSMANRLATRLSGATITVVEPRELHKTTSQAGRSSLPVSGTLTRRYDPTPTSAPPASTG